MAVKAVKTLKNLLFVSLPSLLILFLILELFFRFVIPSTNPPRGYFDEEEKIFHLSRNPKTGMCTIGRLAAIRAEWNVNNMGWNFPVDYETERDSRLIAVIGDSFIEALEVDSDKKYPFLLRQRLSPQYDVYAFGRGGSPMSQYLHLSRYAARHFDPEIMIINICYNDFVESVRELHPIKSYYMQLSIRDGIITEIEPSPDYTHYQYRPMIKLVFENSAVARYFFSNLRIKSLGRSDKNNRSEIEGNIFFKKAEENRDMLRLATSYIVSSIVKENPGRRIILIMDAPREAIYNDCVEDSRIRWLNEMTAEICLNHGAEFIDLTVPMLADYRKNKRKFNSEINFHYDEYGHFFVSEILYHYLLNDKPDHEEKALHHALETTQQ